MKKKLLFMTLLLGYGFSVRANDLGAQVVKDVTIGVLTAVISCRLILPIVHNYIVTQFSKQELVSDNTSASQEQEKTSQEQKPALSFIKSTYTFKDVAGAEEAKEALKEVVDMLKYPQPYRRLGAELPKGVLLEGAPGNGKTLLAKAFAGEVNANFIATNGSAFSAKYYGEGVERVKDLFKTARKHAPCIIFIDEIDGLGSRDNTSGQGLAHVEEDRIVNEFLTQLNGIDVSGEEVFVIAATNFPDKLDPALVRPGRIDRKVQVNSPNQKERVALLALHAEKKKISKDVSFNDIANQTEGFSGADIATLTNRAAILAGVERAKSIQPHYFNRALDQMLREKGYERSQPRTSRLVEYGKAFLGHLAKTQAPIECF